MGTRIAVLLIALCASIGYTQAQDKKWAFGFYGDMQLEAPGYPGTFGVQGKYDFSNRSAVQALVNGRNGYVSVGADYVFSFLDKSKSNWDVFLGAGISQDFYRYNTFYPEEENVTPTVRKNYTMLNGQVGVSRYFPELSISVFTGYKLKFHFEYEEIDPNYVMLGVRYHLW